MDPLNEWIQLCTVKFLDCYHSYLPLVCSIIVEGLLILVLETTVDHWPFLINLSIWLTKIHFGQPYLLYIFYGTAINNLQNVLSLKVINQFLMLIQLLYYCQLFQMMATRPRKKPASSPGGRFIHVKLVLFGKKLDLSNVSIIIRLPSHVLSL